MRTNEISRLFIEAKTAGALIGGLYRARKGVNKRFSLQYLCDRAKIPSKGNLSDVISGRRKLNARFARSLAETLCLEGIEKNIFVYMIQIEVEPSYAKQKALLKRIQSLKDQLKSGLSDVPADVLSPVLFTRVFCSLGIFATPPIREHVLALFRDENPKSINEIIDLLVNHGAIEEIAGCLSVKSSEVRFGNGNGAESNINYLNQCIDFSRTQVRDWYPRKNESFFESSTLSVKKDRYLEALPKIKEIFDSILSDLEEPANADEIVHFGIQIFPDSLGRRIKAEKSVI